MTSQRLARLVRLRKLVEQSAAAELAERQRSLDDAHDDLDATQREMEQVDQLVEEGQPSAQELMVRDGIFRFLPDGSVERGLAVLQIDPRSTRVISPSPEAFNEVN